MKTWIALFRGINVGGNNPLPMAALRDELTDMGLQDVRSYIQSGNVVFAAKTGTAASLGKRIAALVEEHHGFHPQVLVVPPARLEQAVADNPFPEAVAEPKTLHYTFLAKPAKKADLDAIEALRSPTERFALTDTVFYLHAPDGIGRSKLAAAADKHLGVVTTARNHRTVDKLLSMVATS